MVLGTKIWALLAGSMEPCEFWQVCADPAPGALRPPPPPACVLMYLTRIRSFCLFRVKKSFSQGDALGRPKGLEILSVQKWHVPHKVHHDAGLCGERRLLSACSCPRMALVLGAQPGWAQVLVGIGVRHEGRFPEMRDRRVLGVPDLTGGCWGLCRTSAPPESLCGHRLHAASFVLERRGRDKPAYCLSDAGVS